MGKPGANDRGIYDDAIFINSPSGCMAFNANVDPSVFRPGVATLAPGLHVYKKGNHGISRPGGGYSSPVIGKPLRSRLKIFIGLPNVRITRHRLLLSCFLPVKRNHQEI